jgi:His-Xaa-Ser system radical SAM maturase HxsB
MQFSLTKVKKNLKNLPFFRFKEFKDKYLITNDVGEYAFLTKEEFKKYLEGDLKKNSKKYQELKEKGFIKSEMDIFEIIEKYRQANSFLFRAPDLHIIAITKRCNFNCIYCQVIPEPMHAKGYDMNLPTAKKVVDRIFECPNPSITIEFQGGEPLVNWKTLKFIVSYAKKKNKKAKKRLRFALVTNLSLMNQERLNFLITNGVSICTSLDGPQELQNKNRPWKGGDSYKILAHWIKKIKEFQKERGLPSHLNALATITKYSLKYPKEIVDEYLKWGIESIHLRPLSFLGLSGIRRKEIGYSLEEFMEFWKKGVNYIIEINLKGKFICERGIAMMMQKIMGKTPQYLDLRSPCGVVCGQIAYRYDGKVFPCDEARMVGEEFSIGKVSQDGYQKIVSHPTLRSLCIASLLENLPCDYCVYKPYCGTCPIHNYALYGNIFICPPLNEGCKMHSQMLDFIFEKLQNNKIRKVFEKWVDYYS